jgi:hypothetical protein
MQTLRCVAGIDVHKKMLAVVVGRVGAQTIEVVRAKFSSTIKDLKVLEDGLGAQGVNEVVYGVHWPIPQASVAAARRPIPVAFDAGPVQS